ncbi:MAG: TonB-dependent receptor, partial [Candidatus Neomarinimicrobiota bacterium]|nr:TonB-dependent receptor [Candidatus Neomarinimicrobiota bacterium]
MKKLYVFILTIFTSILFSQGLTTSGVNGFVKSQDGKGLVGANIIATHIPSGTQYGTTSMNNGYFVITNMKIGGPYKIAVSYIGYQDQDQSGVYLNLGQDARSDFSLSTEAIEMAGVEVTAEGDDVLNSDRTGAATFVGAEQVIQMPSIKRSTRDLTRLDPRSDGNFSFGGRNWLYNNISLDGSYFSNPFGLDDPAPGGQANAEPVSMDAVEQVTVSIAPFDVSEGGFTGAGINTVTKSGTNDLTATVYAYNRSESLVGNSIGGEEILASPELNFSQTGLSVGGPIMKDKLFFFANFEMERRTDPGTNYIADDDGNIEFGESRVSVATMDAIRQRMKDVYNYETGDYQGYNHLTDNDKMLLKLDYNLSANHNLMFRYNMLRSYRDLGPHGFVLSHNNTGRGPNTSSLPFENSGYRINNNLDSYALELNSRFGSNIANKFFFSSNKFRDFREAKSVDFPTIEIGENGVTYTTLGHEPFSIHNILDQDVMQITNNLSYFMGSHTLTGGVTYEKFKFFNSFNIFRHGVFFLDASWAQFLGGTTFSSIDAFLASTAPDSASQSDFSGMAGSGPFKGEIIEVGQMSFYGQDEVSINEKLKMTAGLRVDIPQYFTEPVAYPFSTD